MMMMMMMMMVKLTCIIILISIIIHHHYHNHHHHHHYYRGLKNLVFPASDRLKLHEQKSFFHIRFPSSPIASYPLTQRGDDSNGDHAVNYAVMATGVEEMMMMNGSCSDDRGDDGCGNSYRTIAAIDLDTVTVVSNFFRSEKYQRNRR